MRRPQIPVDEILESMVDIKTPYRSLGEALEKEGYEITTRNGDDGIVIWISGNSERFIPRNNRSVALTLTKSGAMHAGKFDPSENGKEHSLGKLVSIEIPQDKNSVTLLFVDPEGFKRNTVVTLATACTKTITKA